MWPNQTHLASQDRLPPLLPFRTRHEDPPGQANFQRRLPRLRWPFLSFRFCPSCQRCQSGTNSSLEPYNMTLCRKRLATGVAIKMGPHSGPAPERIALCERRRWGESSCVQQRPSITSSCIKSHGAETKRAGKQGVRGTNGSRGRQESDFFFPHAPKEPAPKPCCQVS